jgi:hypothetical protein
MYHPDIDAWLQSQAEAERLKELERKAAEAWFESLSEPQRHVFAELYNRGALSHVTGRFVRERVRADFKREMDKARDKPKASPKS